MPEWIAVYLERALNDGAQIVHMLGKKDSPGVLLLAIPTDPKASLPRQSLACLRPVHTSTSVPPARRSPAFMLYSDSGRTTVDKVRGHILYESTRTDISIFDQEHVCTSCSRQHG